MKDFKNISDSRRYELLREYMDLLKKTGHYSFTAFCKSRKISYYMMKSWVYTTVGVTIDDIKKHVSEIEDTPARSETDFVQVVPEQLAPSVEEGISDAVENPTEDVAEENTVEESAENPADALSVVGISISCPNGISISLQECKVSALSLLINSIQV